MKPTREGLLVGLAIIGLGLGAPSLAGAAGNTSAPVVVAQATEPAQLLSGTPEPTEEPTMLPANALAASAAVGPEWNAFAKIVVAANDFITLQHSKQQKGDEKFDKTFKISSRKPNYALCEIVQGDGLGSVALWRGGGKIQAHEGGEHAAIIVVLPRHNRRVTDLMGYGCGDTSPDFVVGYTSQHGTLTEAPGPTINGEPTDDVTWTVAPGDQIYVTKEDFFISKNSHLIIASKGYHGDDLVEQTDWTITVNPGLKYSVFDIGG
jgi:hypothetical protein